MIVPPPWLTPVLDEVLADELLLDSTEPPLTLAPLDALGVFLTVPPFLAVVVLPDPITLGPLYTLLLAFAKFTLLLEVTLP